MHLSPLNNNCINCISPYILVSAPLSITGTYLLDRLQTKKIETKNFGGERKVTLTINQEPCIYTCKYIISESRVVETKEKKIY